MSWKDRATVVDQAASDVSTSTETQPTAGSWRDRAEAVGTPPEKSWKGFGMNVISDTGNLIVGAGATVKKAAYDLPKAITESLAQTVADKVTGKDSGQTPVGKEMTDFVDNAPNMAKEMARPLIHPIEYGYEHPVSQALNVITAGDLLKKGAGSAMRVAESKAPNVVERFGARGALNSIDIRPQTLERIAGKENPGEVGAQLGKRLVDEGAIGGSARETFNKAKGIRNKYGEAVDKSLAEIKETNKGMGVYPELADPLKVEATPILKPILDKANDLRDSGYPLERIESRYHRAMYNSLAKSAETNNGFITIDNVGKEMRRVGQMFKKLPPDSDNYNIVAELYGTLADTRDAMIKQVAEQSGNAKLADNLIMANKGYSLYTRILPDIRRAAAKEATGSTGFFKAPVKATGQLLEGPVSKGALKLGGIPRDIAGGIRQILGRAKTRIESNPTTAQSAEESALLGMPTSEPVIPQESVPPPDQTTPVKGKLPTEKSAPRPTSPAPELPDWVNKKMDRDAMPPTRIGLQEFGGSFEKRTGVPAHEANRWMAAFKRSPSEAAKMIADYSSKVIKNQQEGRQFRISVRSLLQQEAGSVKVGGLPRNLSKK